MRYWFYSEGNILGPYSPEEIMALPAFGGQSLVCAENATSSNPDDWKPAEEVEEIKSFLGAGVGSVVSSDNYPSSAFSLESGWNSPSSHPPAEGEGGGSIIDAIDNILRVYGSGEEREEEIRYDFADKFDVKLSKMQEELEAAKWEKTVLIEKVRTKEEEEKNNKKRIEELEAKLKEAVRQIEQLASQNVRFAGEAADFERDAGREDFKLGRDKKEAEEKPRAAAKSISEAAVAGSFEAESLVDRKEDEDEPGIGAGKLKRLGRAKPKGIFDDEERVQEAPEKKAEAEKPRSEKTPEAAESGKSAPSGGLDIGFSAIVYDFTAVTGREKSADRERLKMTIEEREKTSVLGKTEEKKISPPGPLKPPPGEEETARPGLKISSPEPRQHAKSPPVPQWKPAPAPEIKKEKPGPEPAKSEEPQAGLDRKEVKSPQKEPSKDKTERIIISPPSKKKEKAETKAGKKGIKKSTLFFLSVAGVFVVIILGGLGFFFLNDNISLSEFSMMGSSGSSTGETQKIAEPQAPPAAPEESAPLAAERANEAIELVKNHRLEGGRSTVDTWLSNAFMSKAASGAGPEWTATILHESVYVVQYRLVRQKQDPVVYQFEVDVDKKEIVRGINNNAIELLAFKPGKPPERKKTEAKKKPAPKKPSPAQLPLPEPPAGGSVKEPSGFENVNLSANEKVRYVVAQESDEELF